MYSPFRDETQNLLIFLYFQFQIKLGPPRRIYFQPRGRQRSPRENRSKR